MAKAAVESRRVRVTIPRRHDFRCSACGYGAVAHVAPARCPMCGGTTWLLARPRRINLEAPET